VATRKQRRRREKEKRHDYEFVYLDSEGNEVEPDEDDIARPPRRASSSNGKAAAKGQRTSSRRREPQPPSWRRVLKRGAIFLPIFIVTVILIGGKHINATAAIFQAVILVVFFVPFSYFLDSMVWRSHQKRLGRGPAPKR
jgi:hypothetical protein